MASNYFINGFRDLVLWQKSKVLAVYVYKLFATCKDYAFRDQIQRASVSIMNNVAEGFDRYGKKEMHNFLKISRGSLGEVESMLELALALTYIDLAQYNEALSLAKEVRKLNISYTSKTGDKNTNRGPVRASVF